LSTGFKLIKLKSLPDGESSVRCVLEMRKALGDDVRLMMDVNGMWNYDQALRALRKLELANLELIEQPLPYWDIEGMARLRQKVGTSDLCR